MRSIFCAHLIIFLGVLNLDIITLLWSAYIFYLGVIVHTLKMCTDDAGLEQSLVLFQYENAALNGEQKKIHYSCADGIEKSVPHNHYLLSLSKPHYSKR